MNGKLLAYLAKGQRHRIQALCTLVFTISVLFLPVKTSDQNLCKHLISGPNI